MKKRFMVISAAAMAGILMTVTLDTSTLFAAATANVQNETDGIRAKAPQGTRSEKEMVTEETEKERDPKQQAAIDAALTDAGLTEEELTGLRVKKERDDGKSIYEIELYVDAEEYSYEIDADTAKILEQDYEVEEDYDREPDDPDALTRKEAVQIVLDKVEGSSEMDIRMKYERDDGKEIYEGSLVCDGTEYEFELNAKDGQILEWSEERY